MLLKTKDVSSESKFFVTVAEPSQRLAPPTGSGLLRRFAWLSTNPALFSQAAALEASAGLATVD